MSRVRSGLAIGVVNNQIYAIGGFTDIGLVPTIEMYDPVSNTWVTRAVMPVALQVFAIGVVTNRVYAIGGRDEFGRTSRAVEMYDPAGNTWAIKADMPTGRFALAIGVVNNQIYAIGGLGNTYLSTVEQFTPGPTAYLLFKN
jgi:N-acetylneuraminic acid mutarotase